jgi:uncharacterized membrane protein YedE/YeeE
MTTSSTSARIPAQRKQWFRRASVSTAPPATPAAPPQWAVLTVGGVIAVGLALWIWLGHGPRELALFALGLALGVGLFHSRFGFTSAWRQLVAVGQGRALRAHALLLGVACILFTPILATGAGFGGVHATASVAPFGLSVAIGAFLFGIGMQLGGACASGTLFAVGSGQSAIVLTLLGFVAGGTTAAATSGFWTSLPSLGNLSLDTSLGYGGGLAVTLVVLALVVAGSYWVERRRTPPPVASVPAARGFARIVRGSWPLWVGALVLAGLNALVLLTSGSAWGITSAFALWGSKIWGALGGDPSGWAFWSGPSGAALHGSVLANTTSLTDIGIMVGALVASAAAGAFTLHRRIPLRMATGAVLGGIIMGYGSRMAYGCNIGAYLDGIASGSLHGWLWAVTALMGTWVGLKLRPLFGLTNPKPTDSVC